ncbi:MAG: hypothetical protein NTV06_07120 [candidate division Zixibacteria bacterium]|nr:hypothetical protein [candidate division Zixibacteria bacterium]
MGSFIYSMVEIMYYAGILILLYPKATPMKLLQGVGFTFLYRIALGTVLGAVISLLYQIDFSISLTLGISRYLPAVILQILTVPFIIRPIYLSIINEETHRRNNYMKDYARNHQTAIAEKEEYGVPYLPRTERRSPSGLDHVAESKIELGMGLGLNGFERAVRYLGEHHAVLIAATVDREGLLLSSFKRNNFEPKKWAPLSLLFQQANEKILRRNEEGGPDRLELSFGKMKLVIVKVSQFNLLILSNREEDDLLGIRILHAVDMIRKYASERYGQLWSSSPEEKYVSNP